jgi:hypothetical protein
MLVLGSKKKLGQSPPKIKIDVNANRGVAHMETPS